MFHSAEAGNHSLKKNYISLYEENLLQGMRNYILYQKFSSYLWPAWLSHSVNKESGRYQPIIPPVLLNNALREGLEFTNLLSRDELFIDPSGLIAPSYDIWSLEFWFHGNGELFRPAVRMEEVVLERDPATAMVTVSWQHPLFTVKQTLFGARSDADEAVCEVECQLKGKVKNPSLLLAVRPYNHRRIGGLGAIEYQRDRGCLVINKRKSVYLETKADFTLAGDGSTGDINFDNGAGEDRCKTSCASGMGSLALGWQVARGGRTLRLRIGLSGSQEMTAAKVAWAQARDDFRAFADLRIRKGAGIKFPDRIVRGWFDAAKISLLNGLERDRTPERGIPFNYRAVYYDVFGCNRMGYHEEALSLLGVLEKNASFDQKAYGLPEAVGSAYVIAAFADYFTHTRDTDFLQARYRFIREIASALLRFTKKVKKAGAFASNSLQDYCVEEPHTFDLILCAAVFAQIAYLARCGGIFGDENAFQHESSRLARILAGELDPFLDGKRRPLNDFFHYNLYAGFPFPVETFGSERMQKLCSVVLKYYGEVPLHAAGLGWDMVSSLVMGANLVGLRDAEAVQTITRVLRMGAGRYSLPEYVNPLTGSGCGGAGASRIAATMAFAAIRHLIFIDRQDRLDIFPVPLPEWFEAGSEIAIIDAPSRFGPLSIRMIATPNEIQVHFDRLPKYVPPDIMISMPFRTSINEGEDFIVKKEVGNAYIINGWPSLVRFIRK